MPVTKDQLLELFEYSDGNLIWKVKRPGRKNIGDIAGTKTTNGYMQVGVNKRLFKLHRVIFCMHYGYMPSVIDHIDGNPLNNKIENLRACETHQNLWNAKTSISNKSGIKGISFSKEHKKWRAYISNNKKRIWLGFFSDLKDAEKVLNDTRKRLHSEFSRNG